MPRGRHADRAGISKSRRVADFPNGMSRPIHDPVGTDGVRVDGTRVSDGSDDLRRDEQDETGASIRVRRAAVAWNGGRA